MKFNGWLVYVVVTVASLNKTSEAYNQGTPGRFQIQIENSGFDIVKTSKHTWLQQQRKELLDRLSFGISSTASSTKD